MAGAAGGSVLTGVIAPPARAAAGRAALAQATTVEQGALAPAVVVLTDAGTIAVDASLGNDFRVTIGWQPDHGQPGQPDGRPEDRLPGDAGRRRPFHALLGQRLRVQHRAAAAHAQHHGRGDGPARLRLQRAARASGCWPRSWPGSARRPSPRRRAPSGCSRPPTGRPARSPTAGRSWPASCSRSPRAESGSTATGGGCARPGSPRRPRSSHCGPYITAGAAAALVPVPR